MKDVEVVFDEKLVTVTYDPSRAKPEAFVRAIEDAGYKPKITSEPSS